MTRVTIRLNAIGRGPQALCRDARAVSAGGALEMEVARQLREFGGKQSGLEQYAIAKFADSLEVVPRTIAENSGEGHLGVVSCFPPDACPNSAPCHLLRSFL